MQPDTHVLVLGAGVSGLSAARELHNAGIRTTVIEARDRVGGRIRQQDVGGSLVDLGGMWVSGTRGHPAVPMLRKAGVRLVRAPEARLRSPIYDVVEGRYLRLLEKLRAFRHYLRFIRYLENRDGRTAASIADTARDYLDDAGVADRERRHAAAIIAQAIELGYGEPIAGVSAGHDAWETSEALPGGEHLPLGTYRPILDALSKGLDILFGEVATRVRYDRSEVVVQTESNEHRGTHALVTIPLGVLKSDQIAFEPELPTAKRSAVDELGMGTLEKVVMTFGSKWRSRRTFGSISLASDDPQDITYVVDYTPLAPYPTLIGLCVGSVIPIEERAARMQTTLDRALDASMPEPRAIYQTDWQHDPFSRGSYLVVPPGVSADRIADLQAPVGETLRFAGEHTSARHSGYVHGAMLSGIREARLLIASL